MIKSTLWCFSSVFLLGLGVVTGTVYHSEVVLAQTANPQALDSETPSSLAPVESQTLLEASPVTELKATHLVLKLNERKVYVYQDNQVLRSYSVAIGKKGWETPTGNFTVIQMVKDPVWQNPWNGKISPPGPNSPLGERWIGFWTDGKNYIGFHGTPGENLIGQAVSHGCVRMRNADIKELFELVPMGIPVTVQH